MPVWYNYYIWGHHISSLWWSQQSPVLLYLSTIWLMGYRHHPTRRLDVEVRECCHSRMRWHRILNRHLTVGASTKSLGWVCVLTLRSRSEFKFYENLVNVLDRESHLGYSNLYHSCISYVGWGLALRQTTVISFFFSSSFFLSRFLRSGMQVLQALCRRFSHYICSSFIHDLPGFKDQLRPLFSSK